MAYVPQVLRGWKRAPDLAEWLTDVRRQWGQGELLAAQAVRLAALGVQPLAV